MGGWSLSHEDGFKDRVLHTLDGDKRGWSNHSFEVKSIVEDDIFAGFRIT